MAILKRFGEYKGRKYPIQELTSIVDLADIEPTKAGLMMIEDDPGFFEHQTWASVRKAIIQGDNPKYLAGVQKVIDQVNTTIDVETNAYLIDNAVVGFLPDVPSAIQNLPESMITMEPTQTDLAPITVWVAGSINGGLGSDIVAKRGAATVALISKLQAIRPVNLKFVKGNGGDHSTFGILPVETRPMNLTQVSYMLCNAGFMRWCIYTLAGFDMDRVPFDVIFKDYGTNAYAPELAKATIEFLGGDPEHDIYIPPLQVTDKNLNNPVKWVEDTMKQYRSQITR